MTTPEVGQAVLVRRRPGLVRDVRPFQSDGRVVHLVTIEYVDGWNHPAEDQVAWERERGAAVLSRAGLPRLDELAVKPDPPALLGAFRDALRWSSVARIPGLTGEGEELISPWQGAVAVEPYQLEPVVRALDMPRVSLLLADDVGLGKTIEAGLVLTELIARRRIRRVLIVCPASLQLQWREEMIAKFSLEFTVLDRKAITDMQREYGMDANPWTLNPRLITSMDFLRQPDVLQQFLAGSRGLERGHALPWDLLIVDEAHNMSPLGFSDRSDRTEMLSEITPSFEHKVFLTATPHNGFTHSFSGLLELLDPVRFRQTNELSAADRSHLDLVMVRRMKSDLNALAASEGKPKPFPKRDVDGRVFAWSEEERTLADALRAYRDAGRSVMAAMGGRERRVGRFVFSLLTKRLLSSPYAFARTWWQHIEGYQAEQADVSEVDVARRRAEATTSDDEEKSAREQDVARRAGSWLRLHGGKLKTPRDRVSDALRSLGWTDEIVTRTVTAHSPFPPDGKWDAFAAWMQERLLDGNVFREDERVILFTEYKDTHDYVSARLEAVGYQAPSVRGLFGGSSLAEREAVKLAFNDPSDPLRVLVATDVASEGLNLQRSCRYVFHYEIPWNPMRLEQRNGRVDRHGQARDVVAFHFTSNEDSDIEFLDYVVKKVESAHVDLGSIGEVIDRTVEERFSLGGVDAAELDRRVELTREMAPERIDLERAELTAAGGEEAVRRLEGSEARLHLDPRRLRRLLSEAVRFAGGKLDDGASESFRLPQVPETWRRLVDETIRIRSGKQEGSMPGMTFDASVFQETIGDRTVFREKPDVLLLRLGHPLMRRAMTTLRGQAWETDSRLARWTISESASTAEPIIVVSALLQATNELREVVHEELVTLGFSQEGRLQSDAYQETVGEKLDASKIDAWRRWIADRWPDALERIEEALSDHRTQLEASASALLRDGLKEETRRQTALFKARIDELAKSRGAGALERLRKQVEKAEMAALQLSFDPDEHAERQERVRKLQQQLEEEEWKRIREHQESLKARVEQDRERMLNRILPLRFALARLDLLPIAVELVVPQGAKPQ